MRYNKGKRQTEKVDLSISSIQNFNQFKVYFPQQANQRYGQDEHKYQKYLFQRHQNNNRNILQPQSVNTVLQKPQSNSFAPIHLQIQLDDGKTEIIKPKVSDNPYLLADQFCQKHDLDQQMVEYLAQNIEATIQKLKYNQKINNNSRNCNYPPTSQSRDKRQRIVTEPNQAIQESYRSLKQKQISNRVLSSRKQLSKRQSQAKLSLYQRCIREQGSKQYWIEKQKFVKKQQEMKQCTHSPQINRVSQQIALKKSNYRSGSESVQKEFPNKQQSNRRTKSVFQHLFDDSKKINEKKEKKKIEQFSSMKFRPQINNKSKQIVAYKKMKPKQQNFSKQLDLIVLSDPPKKKNLTSQQVKTTRRTQSQKNYRSEFTQKTHDKIEKTKRKQNSQKQKKLCNEVNHSESMNRMDNVQHTFSKNRFDHSSMSSIQKSDKKLQFNYRTDSGNKAGQVTPTVRNSQNSIFNALNEVSLNILQKKKNDKESLIKVRQQTPQKISNKESQKLYSRQKYTSFYYIFKSLLFNEIKNNEEEEEIISIQKINLTQDVQENLIRIIFPILEELEILQAQLNLEEFLRAMDKLFQGLNPNDKNYILKFSKSKNNKNQPSIENKKPTINQISFNMVKKMSRKHLSVYQYSQIKQQLRQKQLQKERIVKQKQIMRQCTFHPKVNQKKTSYF